MSGLRNYSVQLSGRVLVSGSGCSLSDGDGGGDNRFNNDSLELHYHCLCFGNERADVLPLLQVVDDDEVQQPEGLHSVHWNMQGDGVGPLSPQASLLS